jgi:signal-transduction protein with cAMP-binding, CBS, and nucleotidyltransferase domain
MNKKVKDVLLRKSATLITVSSETVVFEALKIMAEKNIGAVMVMDDGTYKGIMTERDYSRKVVLKHRSSTEVKVAEIMTSDLPKVVPADTIEHCMELISEKNIRYLPVEENGVITGIISINDLVKETILSQQETITHLTDYLHKAI